MPRGKTLSDKQVELIGHLSIHGVPQQRIAEALGINVNSVYRYSSKDDRVEFHSELIAEALRELDAEKVRGG